MVKLNINETADKIFAYSKTLDSDYYISNLELKVKKNGKDK